MSLLSRLFAQHAGFSLRFILIGLFCLQVIVIAFLLGLISTYNSRAAVNNVTQQLQAEVSARIEQHLQDFLGTAHQLNQLNANMIAQNVLNAGDLVALQMNFLAQVSVFNTPSSVYFGTPQGGIVGAGREVTGEYYVTETADLRAGTFVKSLIDDNRLPSSVVLSVPNFDATTRPWYQRSVETKAASWSDVYVLFTGDDVAIAASRPVYTEAGELLGVVSVDISAARLMGYLQSLKFGKTGLGFVVEHNGLLVATSSAETAVVARQGDKLERVAAIESDNPLIRSAAALLPLEVNGYEDTPDASLRTLSIDQADYFVQMTPHHDEHGLDWITVVMIPEADFMSRIDQNQRTTLLLSIAAVLISIVVATIIAQKVSQPLQQMYVATRQVGAGRWTQLVHHSRVIEFNEVIVAYNQMVAQIQQTMEQLSSEVARRRHTEAVLRENEERLSLIVEGAQLGTWDWQIQTGKVNFNYRWAEMLGYAPEEITPDVETWTTLVHPHDLKGVMEVLNAHLRGDTDSYQIEQRLRTKDGGWKWVLDTGLVVERDAEGRPLRAAGIHQDISERKFAEDALRASHEELEATLSDLQETQQRMMQQERLAAVGQLAAGIAHDFNNVLSAILMYSQLSLTDTSLDPKLHKRLSVIVEQTRQGAELVQQILDFGRATVMRLYPLNLNTIVEDSVHLAQRTLSAGVEIERALPQQPVIVQADATRIQQAILNLFVNARDAIDGSGTIRVEMILCDHTMDGVIVCAECGPIHGGRWAAISIADSGTGIAPEHLPRIFEPFFTSKGPGGHGLGLAQVHGIVKQHGGHVRVDTRLGAGTTFHLYLPLNDSAEAGSPRLIPETPTD
ncbi:PAS domain-containing protein [bacterium]|nr:PAS domain-containing protein [bacterium]